MYPSSASWPRREPRGRQSWLWRSLASPTSAG